MNNLMDKYFNRLDACTSYAEILEIKSTFLLDYLSLTTSERYSINTYISHLEKHLFKPVDLNTISCEICGSIIEDAGNTQRRYCISCKKLKRTKAFKENN